MFFKYLLFQNYPEIVTNYFTISYQVAAKAFFTVAFIVHLYWFANYKRMKHYTLRSTGYAETMDFFIYLKSEIIKILIKTIV